MDLHFVEVLQDVRNFFRRPIQVISGFRCPHHDLTKKRPGSKHGQGIAADIVVIGRTPVDVASMLLAHETFPEVLNGIGINYLKGTVHIDARPESERYLWTYTSSGAVRRLHDMSDMLRLRLLERVEYA